MTEQGPVVVITGGSGMVGRKLTRLLVSKGYRVRWLVRSAKNPEPGAEVFLWNPDKGLLDKEVLQEVSAIINLAGAGIADKPWTAARKKEILLSRTAPIALLLDQLKKLGLRIPKILCASATGFYMPGKAEGVHTENEQAGSGFLADCCRDWEQASKRLGEVAQQLYIVRIGIVLSNSGGALPVMRLPFRFGLGSALGSGKQGMPWIHEEDLSRLFVHLLETQAPEGIYNGVAPANDTNLDFGKALAKAMHKPFVMPSVPAFVIRLLKGEMADMVLLGTCVSAEKMLATGFVYSFPDLSSALANLEASSRK